MFLLNRILSAEIIVEEMELDSCPRELPSFVPVPNSVDQRNMLVNGEDNCKNTSIEGCFMCNTNGSCICARKSSPDATKYKCPTCSSCIGDECYETSLTGKICYKCISDTVSIESACTKCKDPEMTLIGDSCFKAGACAEGHQVYTYDEFVGEEILTYELISWTQSYTIQRTDVFIKIDLENKLKLGPTALDSGIWNT